MSVGIQATASPATTAQAGRPGPRLDRELILARLRLISGLILFAFCLTHFSNHILGLFLVETMEAWRPILMAPWATPVGQYLLFGALIAHPLLALRSLFLRRTLRMPAAQWAQTGAGLAIPFLLAFHIAGGPLGYMLYGMGVVYPQALLAYWVLDPVSALQMSALVALVWAHACLGLHYWLRPKAWYQRRRVALGAFALIFPSLTLAGFFAAGADMARRAWADPEVIARIRAAGNMTDANLGAVETLYHRMALAWAALILLTLLARALRNRIGAWRDPLVIDYDGARSARALAGSSILEVSRANGIPHRAVCGGRGRCSTCRVAVLAADPPLPAPQAQERATLARIGAGPDVRLSCQVRPRGRISVRRLLAEGGDAPRHPALTGFDRGQEMDLTVMVVDLRRSSQLAQAKLPYDVLYVIDRFLNAVIASIRAAGGHVVCTTGDGAVAIFGVGTAPEAAARGALAASLSIWEAVDRMNQELKDDLPWPLAFGVGADAGLCIVGVSSSGAGVPVNFVGDPGNVAARLEEESKRLGSPVVVSARVAERAGVPAGDGDRRSLELRSRNAPVEACAFATREDLAQAIPAGAPSAPWRLSRRRDQAEV